MRKAVLYLLAGLIFTPLMVILGTFNGFMTGLSSGLQMLHSIKDLNQ